jgi:hypothetical protein
MAITTENAFRSALDQLLPPQQRYAAALFVENVLPLSQDPRLHGVINAAKRADITTDELIAMHHAAKSASVDTYTQCGREINWLCQAGHFVAEAAVACVAVNPPGKSENPAWNAAMHARMARTCECIVQGHGTERCEIDNQYDILDRYLASLGQA